MTKSKTNSIVAISLSDGSVHIESRSLKESKKVAIEILHSLSERKRGYVGYDYV